MKETLPSVEARLLEEIDRAGRCGAYQAVVVAAVRRSLWGKFGEDADSAVWARDHIYPLTAFTTFDVYIHKERLNNGMNFIS